MLKPFRHTYLTTESKLHIKEFEFQTLKSHVKNFSENFPDFFVLNFKTDPREEVVHGAARHHPPRRNSAIRIDLHRDVKNLSLTIAGFFQKIPTVKNINLPKFIFSVCYIQDLILTSC